MKSDLKSLLGYMMKSRKQQDDGPKINEVGTIIAAIESPNPEHNDFNRVIIHPDYPDQKIQIGRKMMPDLKKEVIKFFTNHLENFAWCTQDMKRIHPSIAEHKVNIDPIHKVIKQKLR